MPTGASVYSNITDPVTITDLSVSSLSISGNTTLSGTVSSGNLSVTGDTSITGDLDVGGDVTIGGEPFLGVITVKQQGSSLSTTVDTLNFLPGMTVSITEGSPNIANITGIGSDAPAPTPGAAGSPSQVQFNNGGSLGGATNLIYDNLNHRVGINSSNPTDELTISGQISFTDSIRIGGESSTQVGDKNSIYIGVEAGASVNTESELSNVCIGAASGNSITSGSGNVCIGGSSGSSLLDSNNNTFVGSDAGSGISTVTRTVLIGSGAGSQNSGSDSTSVGHNAGRGNSSSGLVAIGNRSGYINQGGNNTFLGSLSGEDNTTGSNNTFGGHNSGDNNTSGSENTFFGSNTGNGNESGNTCIGHRVGAGGSHNTFVGADSGLGSGGDRNVVLGYSAGSSTDSDDNVIIGYQSGDRGKNNVCIGATSGSNSSQDWNTYVGSSSGSGKYFIEGTGTTTVSGIGTFSFDQGTKTFSGTGNGSVTGSPSGQFYIYTSGKNTAKCEYIITSTGSNTYSISGTTSGEVPQGIVSFRFQGGGTSIHGEGNQNISGDWNVVVGATDLVKSGNNQLVIGAGTSTWMYGTDNYLVGIGTDNPNQKLHVQGGIQQNLPKSTNPTGIRDMVFEYIDNFSIRLKVKCEDGVIRSCVLGLQ